MKRSADDANGDEPVSKDAAVTKIPACQRCRVKKIKCDQNFPKCLKCAKIGAECIVFDPVVGREVLRLYTLQLEDRVKALELQLRDNGINVGDQPQLRVSGAKER